MLLPVLAEIVVPTLTYFALRAVGFSAVWSFALPAIGVAAFAAVQTVRSRTIDTIGVLVFIELAVSLSLTSVTDDPRFSAVRPAIYLLFTGAYFLVTCVVGRPIMYLMATPMATNGGDPVRSAAYASAWEYSPRFRRIERLMTAGVGLVLFVDSAIRIVIVFSFPADQVGRSFLLSNVASIVMIVLVIAIMIAGVRAASPIVDALAEAESSAHRSISLIPE